MGDGEAAGMRREGRSGPRAARAAAALAMAVVVCVPLGQAGAATPYGPNAVARSPVRVHAGTAVLVLGCHNARCQGVAKLVAQVGPPPPEREPGDEGRKVLIGSAPFSFPAETTRELRVALNRRGSRSCAGRSGAAATCSSPGRGCGTAPCS